MEIDRIATMTASRVAKLAGVSVSTVSRVVNSHPGVAAETVAAVQKAMKELAFAPSRRVKDSHGAGRNGRGTRIAFLMFGASNASQAPSFQRLMIGVSDAANALGANLTFGFVADAISNGSPAGTSNPLKILEQPLDGLLLHGAEPEGAIAERLAKLPTVWLMGNRNRPTWGDQVMPDNTAIGTLAAHYLLRRKHRRVAYLGLGGWSWSFGIRALAFSQICRDADCAVHELIASPFSNRDYWGGDLLRAGEELVDQIFALPTRPTGIFVSEDRLLPVVQAGLIERGVELADSEDMFDPTDESPNQPMQVISCNNDARALPLRGPVPPSIDIASEAIGRRGLEHLLWRIAHADRTERFRMMISPTLVDPAGGTARV
jgi:LacI family transcriptional regulator